MILTGVLQAGPAAEAGIRPGDVIVQVAGQPVRNVSELLSAVAALQPGQPATFALQRGNHAMEVQVVPGLRPAHSGVPAAKARTLTSAIKKAASACKRWQLFIAPTVVVSYEPAAGPPLELSSSGAFDTLANQPAAELPTS